MAFTIYDASAPALVRALTNLSAILQKAADSGVPEAELIAGRLAPDMHPLPFQVQSASDSAKGAVARLAQVDIPSMPDTETTLAELRERCAKTIAFIQSVEPAKFEGAEDRTITMQFPGRTMTFPAVAFLTGFALPNVYFHVTTAYAILRHKGVALGKLDYLGGMPG